MGTIIAPMRASLLLLCLASFAEASLITQCHSERLEEIYNEETGSIDSRYFLSESCSQVADGLIVEASYGDLYVRAYGIRGFVGLPTGETALVRQTTWGTAGFSQNVTFTGRPEGTPGFVEVVGFFAIQDRNGRGSSNLPLNQRIPIVFGQSLTFLAEVYEYQSETTGGNGAFFEFDSLRVYDSQQQFLASFSEMQQTEDATYAVNTPEPATAWLTAAGLIGAIWVHRRRCVPSDTLPPNAIRNHQTSQTTGTCS